MSDSVLKSLTLQHLRGSTVPFTLNFDKGKKLTIVYGENGTGKSTICDGLELLGNGRVGSIENRGLGRVNRYWPSIGKTGNDISVTLESNTGTCQAFVGKNEVIIQPPEKRPHVEVLRRAQILSLLETTPATRYAAISRFIDVAEVEMAEAAMRDLMRNTEHDLQTSLTRIEENRGIVQEFWKQAGKPGSNYLDWAKHEVAHITTTDNDQEVEILNGLQNAFDQISSLAGDIKREKQKLDEAIEAREQASAWLDECLAAESIDDIRIVKLLEAARTYLKRETHFDSCPICESTDRIDSLLFRIEERLLAMARLKEAQEEFQTEQSAVQVRENQITSFEHIGTQQIIRFEDFCRQAVDYPEIPLPQETIPEYSEEWPSWISKHNKLPSKWKKAEREQQDKRHFRATLARAVEILEENSSRYHELDAIRGKLNQALEIVVEERHQFTDRVLIHIAAEVGRLYEQVHPGENLNQVHLQLDPSRRASLEIEAAFQGQTAPPQAYFSESHLDTLGLCIFLALAGLDSPEDKILVLDDVLASVDEPHTERLIEMLYQESMKFSHCLITTHYRPWKQKLRWGWLKNGQCQFVELTKWSSAKGLSLTHSTPDTDRLGQLLAENPPDSQLVCAKAGVILEAALDFLTQQYECSIPRRAGGLYTLGDLLPAIDKKLRAALEVEIWVGENETGEKLYQTIPLQPFLDELTRISQARNVFGCHFNALSFELLDNDAFAFGQLVYELMIALVDSNVGWPKNGKSGRYWATTGETRRLYPYKKPG